MFNRWDFPKLNINKKCNLHKEDKTKYNSNEKECAPVPVESHKYIFFYFIFFFHFYAYFLRNFGAMAGCPHGSKHF